MNKRPTNSHACKFLVLFACLLGGNVCGVSASPVNVKGIKRIAFKKNPSKNSPVGELRRLNKVNKIDKSNQKRKTDTEKKHNYYESLFLLPEIGESSAKLVDQIFCTSYDARIVQAKREQALIAALKYLPLPQLNMVFLNNVHGLDSTGSFMSDKNTTDYKDNANSQRESISLQVTLDMGSAIMGLAATMTEQQLARMDASIQYAELYFNVCKAVQAYCTSMRKLWDSIDQVADFRIDDNDMQSRQKVGSISGISALQSKERLSTAIAKKEEAQINLIIAEKKLKQYTPHLSQSDFDKLKELARVNFSYKRPHLDKVRAIANSNLPGVMRAHARLRKSRIVQTTALGKALLPSVSIEATPARSFPSRVKDNSPRVSNISIKTSWTMGVQSLSDMGVSVLEGRKLALEAEKEMQQVVTDLRAAIEKYEQSMMVVELCRSKVESCKVRLAQHKIMDQNEPEAHIEKRSKFKEEMYKAKVEFEDAKEKLSFAFLECMLLSGLILDDVDISDKVARYNKLFRPKAKPGESSKLETKQVSKSKAVKVIKLEKTKNDKKNKANLRYFPKN